LENSHDVINIYRCIIKRYKSKNDLLPYLVTTRKYFNEARYPASDLSVYTKAFCEEFLNYVDAVRDFIDYECHANLDDLTKKLGQKS
jgi:hypothetical protein